MGCGSSSTTETSKAPKKAENKYHAKARLNRPKKENGDDDDKTMIIAHGPIRYRIMRTNECDRLPASFRTTGNLTIQHWYVLMEDVTFLVKVDNKFYVSMMKKGFLSNGITSAPWFDNIDPKSWWLHDWHYGTHIMKGDGTPVLEEGTDRVLADSNKTTYLTQEQADDLFEIKFLEVALKVIEIAFADTAWDDVSNHTVDRALMDPLPGIELESKIIPALRMTEVVEGGAKKFLVNMKGL